MRIGFDVSQTGSHKAGCGYLAASLIESLARIDAKNEYVLYSSFGDFYWEKNPKACSHPANGPAMRKGPRFYRFSSAKRFWRTPPKDFEKRLGNPDIVHANNFFCPTGLAKARLVYTLYDLSFMENPDWSKEDNRTGCFQGLFRASLHADMLLSISEFTKQHFLTVFPHYPEERILVAPLASRFGPESPRIAPKTAQTLTTGEYWLCVGTIEPRKNHALLFEAFAAFRRETGSRMPLVLAGGSGWLMEDMAAKIEELGIADAVMLTGYISDAELAWLYANCRAFLYPSLFEGFGLPVLEAMSMGAAVMASKATSIPEITGGAALLVDPHSVGEMASAMRTLWESDATRTRLAGEALSRAAGFSWQKTARATLEAYERCRANPKLNG